MKSTMNTQITGQGRTSRRSWKACAVLGLMLVATASTVWARPSTSKETRSAGGKQPVSANEALRKPGSLANVKPGAIGLVKPGARRATIGLLNGFRKPGSKRNALHQRKPGSILYKRRALAAMCEEFRSRRPSWFPGPPIDICDPTRIRPLLWGN